MTLNLQIADLPNPEDQDDVFRFAMSFNGYESFGSFAGAMAAAKLKRRLTLDDLRNELFCVARASRHTGDGSCVKRYVELLPYFVALLCEDGDTAQPRR